MTEHYCDLCGKKMPCDMNDLFGSRKLTLTSTPVYGALNGDQREITMCYDCKERMYYYMRNAEALAACTDMLSLPNRIRLLFKKQLKIKER